MKGILTALDKRPITLRSGEKYIKKVTFTHKPVERGYQPFMYDNEDCESPGVMLATDNIEWITEELCTFQDDEHRKFKLEILEEPANSVDSSSNSSKSASDSDD